jgi:hypothetical protein
LIARYSRELQISEDDIEKVLEELRQHALEKLAARKVTLKIRPAGIIPDVCLLLYLSFLLVIEDLVLIDL